ncbi:hypothetical protein ZBT109_0213 [Zymobacter palmae]|uniref:Uncharacterized protein n=1 Tax=Zymobacter palmae TaxID=33074 RepID=A0A348HBK9_9GAMM|nr:hypothetical protein ZBT109_0213 [Zymobacter palmae]
MQWQSTDTDDHGAWHFRTHHVEKVTLAIPVYPYGVRVA